MAIQLRRRVSRLLTIAMPAEERDALLGDLDEEYTARLQASDTRWSARRWLVGQLVIASAFAWRDRICRPAGADVGRRMTFESWRTDCRGAARALRHAPGFAVVAGLTLALGIGTSTAIFSAVYPILIAPLPYPQANRLVMISDVGSERAPVEVTFGTFCELAARTHGFDGLAAADLWRPVLTGAAEPERLDGQRVSASYFRVLGVKPALGRDFDETDAQAGAPPVAILSDALVRRRFNGDPAIVGRQITLNGDAYLVIGVLPAAFENVMAPVAGVWAPLPYRSPAPFDGPEWGHHLHLVGRMRADVSISQVRRELLAVAASPVATFPRPPWADLSSGLIVARLQDEVTRGVRPVLLAIVGSVLVLFTIGIVNVTNLLLGRGARRRSEFAMRAALGAARGRLIRQLLAEGLLLAGCGGLVGLAVAELGVRAIVALSPPALPRVDAIRLSGAAFAFALATTTIAGLLVGLAPGLDAARAGLAASLGHGSRRTTAGHRALRRALVVSEVALALVLLVGAGLVWRSLNGLLAVAPGFDQSHVLTMQVHESGRRDEPDGARAEALMRVLEAVRAVPGVNSAAFTSQLPLSGDLDAYGVELQSSPAGTPGDDGNAFRYAVTPDYFAAMRIRLRRGRLLDARDSRGGEEAILVSESFANRAFHDRDPVGQHVRFGPEMGDAHHPWDVIVGVVADVKQASLALDEPNAFYVGINQWAWVDNVESLVVRTTGDAAALAPAVRQAIWTADSHRALARVTTMDALVAGSEGERAFALVMLEAFAIAALLLAAVGTYGVLAGNVAERTREIGVRAALGASPGDLLGLIVGEGLTLTGVGVVFGLGGAALASQAVTTLLFGVSRLDVVTYSVVIAILGLVSVVACAVPARRAARIDPLVVLRLE